MRAARWIPASLLFAGVLSCGDSPEQPASLGRLIVFVQWDQVGVPDRRIQLLEAGLEQWTDSTGIAEFAPAPGLHTVRAHGITTPGPPPAYIDSTVTLLAGQVRRLEILDCLPCNLAR